MWAMSRSVLGKSGTAVRAMGSVWMEEVGKGPEGVRQSNWALTATTVYGTASLALSSLRCGVGVGVGMKATARTGAVVLGCCGCFATARFFVVL